MWRREYATALHFAWYRYNYGYNKPDCLATTASSARDSKVCAALQEYSLHLKAKEFATRRGECMNQTISHTLARYNIEAEVITLPEIVGMFALGVCSHTSKCRINTRHDWRSKNVMYSACHEEFSRASIRREIEKKDIAYIQ